VCCLAFLPCCSIKRCRASALQRSTVRQTSQRRSALLNRAAEQEAWSPYPDVSASLALPWPAWLTWWPLCYGRSWSNVAMSVRPYLYHMNTPCTGTSLSLPRWRCPATLHWFVTHWTVQLPAHLTPSSRVTPLTVNGNMTVDTLSPTAPHTTATNITALAPRMTTLLYAALSCGTKRAYRRAISSYANLCEIIFPGVPVFPASSCVLGAFIAHLHSQRYTPAILMTISAISYLHNLAGKVDPTQLFVIKKLLVGHQKMSATPDTRLPISLSILRKFLMLLFDASSAYFRL